MQVDTWTSPGTIAQLVVGGGTALLAVFTGKMAWRTREAAEASQDAADATKKLAKSTETQSQHALLLTLIEMFQSSEARRARRILYRLTDKFETKLRDQGLSNEEAKWLLRQRRYTAAADYSGQLVQSVAYMVKLKTIDEQMLRDNWGDTIVKVWDRAKPWIDRRREHERKLWKEFGELASRFRQNEGHVNDEMAGGMSLPESSGT